ncbi:hypothetical protein [Parendozoicomonas haliclonae]|uniref:Uncharacterized protein n=1 Tax=Parendozoicomonas haliclonae TaxID=1960125 RepID=A0A1X7AJP4_9GAMM|nr:hypothetical protein [Parendozoicomonas haliclonae]SMA46245.1 hypothetical protein EHSB41UT_02110 [Parendozoicomonas haliclonae]
MMRLNSAALFQNRSLDNFKELYAKDESRFSTKTYLSGKGSNKTSHDVLETKDGYVLYLHTSQPNKDGKTLRTVRAISRGEFRNKEAELLVKSRELLDLLNAPPPKDTKIQSRSISSQTSFTDSVVGPQSSGYSTQTSGEAPPEEELPESPTPLVTDSSNYEAVPPKRREALHKIDRSLAQSKVFSNKLDELAQPTTSEDEEVLPRPQEKMKRKVFRMKTETPKPLSTPPPSDYQSQISTTEGSDESDDEETRLPSTHNKPLTSRNSASLPVDSDSEHEFTVMDAPPMPPKRKVLKKRVKQPNRKEEPPTRSLSSTSTASLPEETTEERRQYRDEVTTTSLKLQPTVTALSDEDAQQQSIFRNKLMQLCDQYLDERACRTREEEQAQRTLLYGALVASSDAFCWPRNRYEELDFSTILINPEAAKKLFASGGDEKVTQKQIERATGSLFNRATNTLKQHRKSVNEPTANYLQEEAQRVMQEASKIKVYCQRHDITPEDMEFWSQSAPDSPIEQDSAYFENLIFGTNAPQKTRDMSEADYDRYKAQKHKDDLAAIDWLNKTLSRQPEWMTEDRDDLASITPYKPKYPNIHHAAPSTTGKGSLYDILRRDAVQPDSALSHKDIDNYQAYCKKLHQQAFDQYAEETRGRPQHATVKETEHISPLGFKGKKRSKPITLPPRLQERAQSYKKK